MIAPAGRARWPPVPDLIEIGDISIADALAARGVALRPETPADEPAVRAIYVAHRDVEFAALPEPLRGSIVNSQFDMQRAAYRQSYSDAMFLLVTQAGAPIGRLYLAGAPDAIVLLDILIDGRWRSAGIGGALIEALVAAAAARGQAVRLHVEKSNRARGMYERLGFRVTGDAGLHWEMEARAGQAR